tara:strand:- start:1426 stop:1839 length:414 start_codon:yes stop_codon:yes gene_type:complete
MVQGLKSLERKLNREIPRAVKKNLRTALAVFADKVVATAEGLVPERTGELKNSIGWVWGDKAPKGSISLGQVKGGDPDLTITVFAGNSEAFQARWVEFGTKLASAHPYFFPAYRLQRRAGKSRITRAIKKGLKEGAR